jgi:beta-lactamase regulating signal transducer with metallopeptidase domain
MSVPVSDAALWTAVWILVKGSVLVTAAALAHVLTRRRTSAAARHLAWTFAVVGLLLLPLLSATLPTWDVAVRRVKTPDAAFVNAPAGGTGDQSATAVSIPVSTAIAPADGAIPWATVTLALYVAGVLALLMRLAAQRLTLTRLARQAADLDDPDWRCLLLECARTLGVERPVRLLRSRDRTMPMAFGTRSPVILLPAIADTWSDDRRRAVLLHELAHIGRHDCLTQMVAAIACAVYWIHPGVWWVARRLRVERELACDDRVLTAGTRAREYAGHLLELAHALGGGRAPALVVSMARPRQLEGRMLAVMDVSRNRNVPGFRSRLAGLAITAALILPLASAQTTAVDASVDESLALPAPSGSADFATQVRTVPGPMTPQGPITRSVPEPARSSSPATAIAQRNGRGTWEIRPTTASGMVHLRLTEGDSSSGSTIALERLEGLSAAQLSGAGGSVRFTIKRDAGTFTFEGTARDGVGAGTFTFAPNPAFAGDLEKRGLGRPTADEQYDLARSDIGFAYLDELTKQGYARPALAQLVRAGQHGVRLDYLRDMGAVGYRLGALDPLITLRDHGVTPEFVRQLAEQGFKGLSADELRRTRDHGVTPEFMRELRDLGYTSLTIDELVNTRDHGVNPQFVRELVALGHRKLALDEVVRLRDHGVNTEFVRDLSTLGHPNLPLEELVRLRDHGVSPDYVRDLRDLGQTLTIDQLVKSRDHGVTVEFVSEVAALGYRNLSLDSLIRLRDHGVTASYIRELKELGYDRLDLDELVALRDHGVTPEKIRRANARAGTRLPLDMIKALANGGLK